MSIKNFNYFLSFIFFSFIIITIKSLFLKIILFIQEFLKINRFQNFLTKFFLENFYDINMENWEDIYLILFHKVPFDLLLFRVSLFAFIINLIVLYYYNQKKEKKINPRTSVVCIIGLVLSIEPLYKCIKALLYVPSVFNDHIIFWIIVFLIFVLYSYFVFFLYFFFSKNIIDDNKKHIIVAIVSIYVYFLSYDLWSFFQQYSMIFVYFPDNVELLQNTTNQLNFILCSFGGGLLCSNEGNTELAEPKDPCLAARSNFEKYCDLSKQIDKIKTVKGGNSRIRIITNAGIYLSKGVAQEFCNRLKHELDKCYEEFAASKKK